MLTAAIIGAGPSGLMAAEVLADGGARVVVHDRMAAPARKFLMAGRGGLNLTHSEPLDRLLDPLRTGAGRCSSRQSGPSRPRRSSPGAMASASKPSLGSSGRMFPKTMKASPLLRAWLQRLDGLGVELRRQSPWTGLDRTADVTILAMGGASWPNLGADGGWVPVLRELGIEVHDLAAANCGVIIAMVGPFRGALRRNAAQAHRRRLRRPDRARRGHGDKARARRRRDLCAEPRIAPRQSTDHRSQARYGRSRARCPAATPAQQGFRPAPGCARPGAYRPWRSRFCGKGVSSRPLKPSRPWLCRLPAWRASPGRFRPRAA